MNHRLKKESFFVWMMILSSSSAFTFYPKILQHNTKILKNQWSLQAVSEPEWSIEQAKKKAEEEARLRVEIKVQAAARSKRMAIMENKMGEAAMIDLEEVRIKAEKEEAEKLMIKSSQMGWNFPATEDIARIKAEKEKAASIKAEEAARIKAEEEAAELKSKEEATRIKAEKEEADKIRAEEEAARIKAEEDARIKAEEEAARIKAEEEEAARLKVEETARIKAEEEAAKFEAEKEDATIIEEEVEEAANFTFGLDLSAEATEKMRSKIFPNKEMNENESDDAFLLALAYGAMTVVAGVVTAAQAVEVIVDTITDRDVYEKVGKAIEESNAANMKPEEKGNGSISSKTGNQVALAVKNIGSIARSVIKASRSAKSASRLAFSASETSQNFLNTCAAVAMFGMSSAKELKNNFDEFNLAREERIQEQARIAEEDRRQKEMAEAKRLEEEKRKEALRLEEEKRLKELAEAQRLEEEKRQREIAEAKRIEEERQKEEALKLELEREQKVISDAMTREVEKQQMELALEAARLEDKYSEQLSKLGNDSQAVEAKMKSVEGLDINELELETVDEKVEGNDVVSLPFYLSTIGDSNDGKNKGDEPSKNAGYNNTSTLFFAS